MLFTNKIQSLNNVDARLFNDKFEQARKVSNYAEMAKLLEKIDENLVVPGNHAKKPESFIAVKLTEAIKYFDNRLVGMLLDRVNDPSKVFTSTGDTPLMAAARAGDMGIATACIKKGFDLNAMDDAGFTPICHAAKYRSDNILKMFMEKGADISQKFQDPSTGNLYGVLIFVLKPLPYITRKNTETADVIDAFLKNGYKPTDAENPLVYNVQSKVKEECILNTFHSYNSHRNKENY